MCVQPRAYFNARMLKDYSTCREQTYALHLKNTLLRFTIARGICMEGHIIS